MWRYILKKHDIQNLYDTLFDTAFLIRYGYYDVNMRKIESNNINDRLLEEHYGKSENFYLRIFNLQDLSNLVKKKDLRCFFDFDETNKNADTEPILFNIPKNKYTRREYKMINIFSYLQLCYFIEKNKQEFINIFIDNKFSTSKYFNQLDFNFKFTKQIEQRLLYVGNRMLTLDLSNFYHTLYTHSIPWVITGKQQSKAKRRGGFANDLDTLIQKCQYTETHGIPVGNIISRIIAELYMCHIDRLMEDRGYVYSRYVDDIKFVFTTDAEKEAFLTDFHSLCRDFNLILNDNKTKEYIFPFENNIQKIDIFNYFDDFNQKTKVESWKNRINNFIDFCLIEEGKENKGAIKCIFSVIINKMKDLKLTGSYIQEILLTRENVTHQNLYERILDISLKDSSLSNKFLNLTENLVELGIDKKQIKQIVKEYVLENEKNLIQKLDDSVINGWNQEVYQLLLYSVIFDLSAIATEEKLIDILSKDLDDYSKCLCVILWLKEKYEVEKLLSILENVLSEIHLNYDEGSIRMQERYWLLRYFMYHLIQNNLIPNQQLNNHFSKCNTNKKSQLVESELNKDYVLDINTSMEKSKRMINQFYKLLLDENVALVELRTIDDVLFEFI